MELSIFRDFDPNYPQMLLREDICNRRPLILTKPINTLRADQLGAFLATGGWWRVGRIFLFLRELY